jgi:hypothetical protein
MAAAALGTDAERIFVRSELDDFRLVQSQLARELRDGFAGLIGRDRAHVRGENSQTSIFAPPPITLLTARLP